MSAGNDELDSQLSAMFDDELPAQECELLARRLARDEALKARWGRFATIGAAIRAERGLRLDSPLSLRVSSVIAAEPSLLVGSARTGRRSHPSTLGRWWQPVAGAAMAASVAALAVLWMRQQSPEPSLIAQIPTPQSARAVQIPIAPASSSRAVEPDSYVVPATSESRSIVPPTVLANYVVAHSEFSMPLLRHNLLSALMAAETGAGVPAVVESTKPRRIQNAEPAR
jgi:sigma-E factor negative regulatory protein RseA